MSDLIKREDAIKATWQEPSYTDPLNVLTEVRDRIKAVKAVDAVEIVRCGECVYYRNNRCDNADSGVIGIVNPLWYCAEGVRRAEQ